MWMLELMNALCGNDPDNKVIEQKSFWVRALPFAVLAVLAILDYMQTHIHTCQRTHSRNKTKTPRDYQTGERRIMGFYSVICYCRY